MTASSAPVLGAQNQAKTGGRVLIVGSTGFIGRFIAEACLDLGRPTYLLVRPGSSAFTAKAHAIHALQKRGAIIINGTITDQRLMEKTLQEHKIEVVISAVGGDSILDQLKLVDAIKTVGTVKRFLPSEFGHDIEKTEPVEPGLQLYKKKRKVRRAIEEGGIPYTYICCNSIAAWPYHDNTHPSDLLPPLDLFHIYGDGNIKAYFVAGMDIGKFTIKAINDQRTVNKSVHFRPQNNLYNINELASLWEKKIKRTLPRVTLTEQDLLNAANEMRIPESVVAALTHDIFIQGCQVNFELDQNADVEATCLYPDTQFRSVEECFDDFAAKLKVNGQLMQEGVVIQPPTQTSTSEVFAITLSAA